MGKLAQALDAQNKTLLFLQTAALVLLKKGIVTDEDLKAAIAEADQKLAARSIIQPTNSGNAASVDSGSSGRESKVPDPTSDPANPGSSGLPDTGDSAGTIDESHKPVSVSENRNVAESDDEGNL